jgi:hypothetical protein
MIDETETIRRERLVEINSQELTREGLALQYGKVWDSKELFAEFEILGFAAPYAIVKRIDDGVKGSVEFSHSPRFYFNWQEDK